MKKITLITFILLSFSARAQGAPLPWRLGLSFSETVQYRHSVNVTVPVGLENAGVEVSVGSQGFSADDENGKARLRQAVDYSVAYVAEAPVSGPLAFRVGIGAGLQTHPKSNDHRQYKYLDLSYGFTSRFGQVDFYIDALLRSNLIKGSEKIYLGDRLVPQASVSPRMGFNWWFD